jgi:phosphohistidine swiveling domain-containing protein
MAMIGVEVTGATVTLLSGREVDARSQPRVGGKALGLAALGRAGARVPAWFVVPVEGFRAHLGHIPGTTELGAELRAMADLDVTAPGPRARMKDVAMRLRDAVMAEPVAVGMAASIAAALRDIAPGPFAVRSSMVGEDAADRSFAGQFDTFLFQRDVTEVVDAIRRCWASAFTERSIVYRVRTRALLDDMAMAVVVQRMVNGHVSGVLFTANPTNGRRDEAVLTGCWGLGEGVVSGACATDELVLSHAGDELSAMIVHKDVQLVIDESGRGTHEASVPEDRRDARCLTPAEARQIVEEGVRLAFALGGPQDLEWTIDDAGIHVLQARPITALPTEVRAVGPHVVWDNSNIQESYCGVTTPLTFSFANRAYASVYEQVIRLLGLPESVMKECRPALRNLLGLVEGRVYYNINNWYRMLLLSPSFHRNKEDMEKMMGLEEPVDFIEGRELTAREKLAQSPRMARAAVNIVRALSRLDASVVAFNDEFEATVRKIDRATLGGRDFSALMALAEQLRVEAIDRWEAPLVNDNFVMMSSGKLRRILERATPSEAKPLWNALVAGEEGIESTEPTRLLMRMARTARTTPALAGALREGTAAEVMARVRRDHSTFAAEIDRYLERYGDRCMGELKLETRSLREDPSFLVQVLRNYLDRPDLDPDALSAKERAGRAEAEGKVAARLGPLERVRFRRALRDVRKGVKARENMRLARTRLFGLYRDIYRAAGARLHEARRLDDPEDIFYLTVEELEAYHEGTAVTVDLAALARLRKAEFARYQETELPNRFETRGAVYHGNRLRADSVSQGERDSRILRGAGCSAGVVEAKLRIVLDPHGDLSVNGQILTTMRTDPGWAPLFPTASGVLVERGSTLSHSAVVARELGLPAVVGVPNLLKIVRDGERVRLDGSAGTIERLDVP